MRKNAQLHCERFAYDKYFFSSRHKNKVGIATVDIVAYQLSQYLGSPYYILECLNSVLVPLLPSQPLGNVYPEMAADRQVESLAPGFGLYQPQLL